MDTTNTTGQAYYNEYIDAKRLDPQHDAQDAIALLVHQFVTRNKFTATEARAPGSLDNVTPAQWRRQVNEAARTLDERLTEVMEEFEEQLHNGRFSR